MKDELAKKLNDVAMAMPYDIRNHTPMAFYEKLAEAAIEYLGADKMNEALMQIGFADFPESADDCYELAARTCREIALANGTLVFNKDEQYLKNKEWTVRTANGQQLWTKQGAFDAVDMCLDDAVKAQEIIDNWTAQTKAEIKQALAQQEGEV